MKVSALFCFLVLFLLQFSVPTRAQSAADFDRNARIARVKADILQDISILRSPEQAFLYTQLGDSYRNNNNQKEGTYWLTKSVEVATNPAADYKNDGEKLDTLSIIMYRVSENDPVLWEKLLARIKEIKIDESDAAVLEKADKTYIRLALQMLNKSGYEDLALEFALASLRGKKPAIDNSSEQVFWKLKIWNEKSADSYFAKMLEAVRTNADQQTVWALLNVVESEHRKAQRLSDAQMRNYLELTLFYIQKEIAELKLGQRDNCTSTRSFAIRYKEEYKRLLPEKAPLVEQAAMACQNADIDPENKPDFIKNHPKPVTVQDHLDIAREIKNHKVKAIYLMIAAQLAGEQKDYASANEYLEMIEKDARPWNWLHRKIEINGAWANRLIYKGDYAGVAKILENAGEARPFIIVRSLDTIWQTRAAQKEFLLSYMNQARADFSKLDKPLFSPSDMSATPGAAANLTQFYVRFGFTDEALINHSESVKYLNRYTDSLPAEYKDWKFPYYWAFSTFQSVGTPEEVNFVNRNYDRIYENISKIEYAQNRIMQRIYFLQRYIKITPEKSLAAENTERTETKN